MRLDGANSNATVAVPLNQRLLNAGERQDDSDEREGMDYENERTDEDQGDDAMEMRDATGEAEEEREQSLSSPWFLRSFWGSRSYNSNPKSSPSYTSTTVTTLDSRDQEDEIVEREEGGDGFGYGFWRGAYTSKPRTVEPLKRGSLMEHNSNDGPPSSKRRRLMSMEPMATAFYRATPALTPAQHALMEYASPNLYMFCFVLLGYSKYAIYWGFFIYFGHSLQTLLTNFGPRYHYKPLIQPIWHSMMDVYLWNQPLINALLLFPTQIFGKENAYWLAVVYTFTNQQLLMALNLKTHFEHHKKDIPETEWHGILLRLFDAFVVYNIVGVLFVLAKILDMKWMLYLALTIFNVSAYFLIMAHKHRVDAAMALGKKQNKIAVKKEN